MPPDSRGDSGEGDMLGMSDEMEVGRTSEELGGGARALGGMERDWDMHDENSSRQSSRHVDGEGAGMDGISSEVQGRGGSASEGQLARQDHGDAMGDGSAGEEEEDVDGSNGEEEGQQGVREGGRGVVDVVNKFVTLRHYGDGRRNVVGLGTLNADLLLAGSAHHEEMLRCVLDSL